MAFPAAYPSHPDALIIGEASCDHHREGVGVADCGVLQSAFNSAFTVKRKTAEASLLWLASAVFLHFPVQGVAQRCWSGRSASRPEDTRNVFPKAGALL